MTDKDMDVLDHLTELRKRIIICLVSVGLVTFLIYDKVVFLIDILMRPIAKFNLSLVYFNLTEGFATRIEVSLMAALVITSPIIIYEILAFLRVGLTKKESKLLYKSTFIIYFLFTIGTVFGYTMVLPYSLGFLISYGGSYLKPVLNGNSYFNFIGIFCIYIGFTFIIPYLLVVLGKLSLISSKILRKKQIWVIVGVLTIEGFVLPAADLFTFFIVAAPILIMYELSIWIIFLTERKKRRKQNVPSNSRKSFKFGRK